MEDRRVEVRVVRDAIVQNLNAFRAAQGLPVAPVLKSNAYGHGISEVGSVVAAQSVPFICVNSLGEAATLRAAAVSSPILVISYTPLAMMRENTLSNISFAVVSIEELRRLAASGVAAKIQLEFDTGMHRHGILPEELDEALALAAHPALALEGAYSHLADGETRDSELTRRQIAAWNAVAKTVREKAPHARWFHLSATTGVAFAHDIDANVARLGLGLYGFNDSLLPLDVRPALEVRARVASVRTVKAGERVGYNGTYTATSDRRIATVPVGYYEGIDRRLSNAGVMLVRGKACPIVGRVSMNITSLDVTELEDVTLDEEVVAISANPDDPNSVANIAKQCGTISYEVLVNIPSELPRVIV